MQNKQRNRVILWRFPKSPLTLLLGELVQQTGLAHAHVADDDVLEDVVVVVRTACHFDGNCASNRETKQQIIHISRCQHCLRMIHKCKVWASVCWWMRNPQRQWEMCVYDERTIALALTVIEQSVCPPIEAGYHFHVRWLVVFVFWGLKIPCAPNKCPASNGSRSRVSRWPICGCRNFGRSVYSIVCC